MPDGGPAEYDIFTDYDIAIRQVLFQREMLASLIYELQRTAAIWR